MSKSIQHKTKSRQHLPADTSMTELVPAEWGLVTGGTRLDGAITKEVQTSLSVGTTGGTAKGGDYDSLWSFTTLATTPSCAIVIAITLS
ncbi:hypothetical protein [Cognatazoarcus halotolerans]|uniref:hypothetical protein n=1 Tax=Cognatazoarcus halotolerans TaxID=2686016 RepID=UPI00135BFFE6|nr:hypothetical protein [Cognatazoarcus halotolerans]MCB1897800.1 hypothetical protein [Rhodocyclaceae bacterium]MCP5233568.1 hypothetical protein [Zoogloeaceae bacterium]MCP5307687.1 hypothetical protein [Zoogloeaceae bacterium]